MIKVGDYLYFYSSHGSVLNRMKIARETKTQWILENNTRVKKDGLKKV